MSTAALVLLTLFLRFRFILTTSSTVPAKTATTPTTIPTMAPVVSRDDGDGAGIGGGLGSTPREFVTLTLSIKCVYRNPLSLPKAYIVPAFLSSPKVEVPVLFPIGTKKSIYVMSASNHSGHDKAEAFL